MTRERAVRRISMVALVCAALGASTCGDSGRARDDLDVRFELGGGDSETDPDDGVDSPPGDPEDDLPSPLAHRLVQARFGWPVGLAESADVRLRTSSQAHLVGRAEGARYRISAMRLGFRR